MPACCKATGPPLLGLAGESGEGKSWRSFALAECATADNSLVVLVEVTGDAAADVQAAADLFWYRIKHNTTAMSLAGMHRLRRDLLPAFDGPWLTVLIDNVQSSREAIALATAGVESDGVRLAINGPPSVVRAFEVAARGRARVASVVPFRPAERDAYLQRRLGDAWIDVPGDVRDTLLQPLLAGIYCDDIAETAGWTPTIEYALYDRAWARLDAGSDPAGEYSTISSSPASCSSTLRQGFGPRRICTKRFSINPAAMRAAYSTLLPVQNIGWRMTYVCVEMPIV